MKRLLALFLAVLMLLTSCGGVGDVTESPDGTDPVDPVIRNDYSIAVKEDTFVCLKTADGDQSGVNFGSEKSIEIKGEGNKRYGYLKFDISSLVGDEDFKSIYLDLTVFGRQTDIKADGVIAVCAGDPDWSEGTLTYLNQPNHYSEISRISDLKTEEIKGGNTVVKSFPVTDYVRKCLERGMTEIALYVEDATPVDSGIHIQIYSKENGQGAPELKVSYTKEDNNVYTGKLGGDLPELSENGLDKIFGISKGNDKTVVSVTEDTYIHGNDRNAVRGSDTVMEIKDSKDPAYNRLSFVKFDITEFYDIELNSISLKLTCHDSEDSSESPVNIYSCDPNAWDEDTLTYNLYKNNEKMKEELVATGTVKLNGGGTFDVTSYVKDCITYGETEVSFIIENDGASASAKRYMFDTKERKNGKPAELIATEGLSFTTYIEYENENPWQVAMDAVTVWLERWEEIKKGGDKDAEKITWDKSEFTQTVSVASVYETNGDKTNYRNYSTRLISTLNGYKKNNAEPSLYDEYGGFMGGEKYEATGYFYTTKIGDRWWTIDPLGYPFYRVACVEITPGVSSAQKKTIVSEFNTNSKWAAWATQMFKDLGFNSTGGWSDIKTLSKVDEPLAQTKILNTMTSYMSKTGVNTTSGGSVTSVGSIMPVFDPGFVTHADENVKSGTKGYGDKAYIYGWMGDNELPGDETMLDNALQLDPTDSRFIYTYATAWTFMYLKTGKDSVSVSDVTTELRREFKAMVYDKYYEVVTGALDKYAPNHQFMGSRYIAKNFRDEYIMRVSGYWCDVISVNFYDQWTPDADMIYKWQLWAGKPFIVTEWYAKGMDIWEKDNRITNQSGAGFTVKTQEDRGKFYQNYALGLLECKGCVGFDWFKYWDNDPDDKTADKSNRDSNKGIFSTAHEEYTDVTKYMEELNNNKYSLIEFFDER